MKFDTKTIDEVTETLIDYRGKTPPKTTSGVKLITAKIIKDGFIVDDNFEYISEETYQTWMRRGLPKQGDILITTEAPLGQVAQLRTPEKVALAQRVILLRGHSQVIDQQYYFQALKSPFLQAGLQARATGTTVAGIKQSELRQVEIPYYPLPTQRKIAAILSAYDDLIENNTRRIQILEEMALTIYREWFVHFRFPGHEKMGREEVNWQYKMIQDLPIQIIDGDRSKRYPKRSEFQSEGVLFLNTTNIIDNRLDLSNANFVKQQKYDEIKKGRLQSYDIVMTTRGSIGKVALFNCKCSTGLINAQMLILRSDNQIIDQMFLFYLLRSEEYQENIRNFASGSAQPQIPIQDLKQIEIPCPPIGLQRRFSDFAYKNNELIKNLQCRNATLRATRDLILPKLISGEIDVSELDIDISEV